MDFVDPALKALDITRDGAVTLRQTPHLTAVPDEARLFGRTRGTGSLTVVDADRPDNRGARTGTEHAAGADIGSTIYTTNSAPSSVIP